MYQEEGRIIDRGEQPKPNFVGLFNQRLAAIPPLPSHDQYEIPLLRDYALPDTKRVVKALPAIVFITGKTNPIYHAEADFDIWIEDPSELDRSYYPHGQLTESMKSYVRQHSRLHPARVSSAELFERENNERILVLDIKDGRQSKENMDEFEDEKLQWAAMARRYHITNIYGDFPQYGTKYGEVARVLTADVVGKIREDEFLRGYAQRNTMTNTEWMRFRTRALTAKASGVSVTYDNLVKESRYHD